MAMSRFLVLTVFLYAASAQASTLCVSFAPDSVTQSYSQSGSVCQVDGLTFSDLTYRSQGLQSSGQIMLDVDTTGSSGPTVNLVSTSGWSVPAGSDAALVLFFSVTSVSGHTINGVSLSLDAGLGWDPQEDNITPGSVGSNPGEAASLNAFLAIPSAPAYTSEWVQPQVTNSPPDQLQSLSADPAPALFPGGQTNLTSHLDLFLAGGDAGFANQVTLSDVSETLLLSPWTPTTPADVPEPWTCMSVGSGMVMLGLVLRRRALRHQA